MKSLLLLFLTSIAITTASRANEHSAATAFSSIPSKKPALYAHVRTWEAWRNPSLRIQDAGIFVNDSSVAIPSEKLLAAFAKLPAEAWPYGRIIAISVFGGPTSSKSAKAQKADSKAQKAILEQVLSILKSVGIEGDLWPSA